MVAVAPRSGNQARIRDHGRFWLLFTALVLLALLLSAVAFLTVGPSAAGFVLLAEGGFALGLGIH